MYLFSMPGYIIIAVAFLVCLFILTYFRKKLKSQIQAENNLAFRKYGFIFSLIGSIVFLTSIIFHVYVQIDIKNTPLILRLISGNVFEPVIVLTIIGFFVGLTTLIIGLYYLRSLKRHPLSLQKRA